MTRASGGGTIRRGLVGREPELAELREALEGAREGHGGVWLVGGEPGIGKTRLLESLAEAAEPTEVWVLWGRCWEGGRAPAYWPWVQVLRAAVAVVPADALAARLGSGAGDVASLVPDVAARLPGVEPAPASEGARFRLFDSVSTFLIRTSAATPLLVALDDLHAADEASLLLLEFLAAEAPRAHLAIVGAFRDAEVRASPRLTELLSAIARHGSRLHLRGLERSGVEALFEAAAGTKVSAELLTRVHESTEGNPFLIKQMAQLVRARPSPPRSGERLPLPEEAHAIVSRRVAPLREPLRGVLRAAAVLGREFDLVALAALTGCSPPELLDELEEARRQALAEQVAPGRWSFAHALLREVLYDELAPSARVKLHRRAADVLEAHAPAELAPVAHHRFEAARSGEETGAAEACTRAGEQAVAALAFEDAAAWYERALEVLDVAGVRRGRLRYDVLMALGRARFGAGQFDAARDAYRPALDAARALGDPERFAQAALGFFGLQQLEGGSVAFVEEALAGLPAGDSATRARLLVSLGGGVLFTQPARWRTAAEMCDEALAMARRVGEPETRLTVALHWLACHFEFDPLAIERRVPVTDEALRLSAELHAVDMRIWAHQVRFCDLFQAGEIAAAAAQAQVAAAEAEPLRLPHHLAFTGFMRAALALLAGQLDVAEDLARGAHSVAGGSWAAYEAPMTWYLMCIRRERGDFEGVQALLERARSWEAAPVGHLSLRADEVSCAAELGREEARRELDALVADVLAWRGVPLDGSCLVSLAHACWVLGAHEHAPSVYELLLPHAGWLVSDDPVLPAAFGAADRHLGQLCALLQRYQEAESHFEAAHALHRRWGAPGFLAHGQADHARMLLARDGPGDRARGAQLAAEAAAGYAALGMVYYQARVRDLFPRAPSAAQPPLAVQRGVLRFEGEYWSVEYSGRAVRLRDSKGMRYLARLLSAPGRELHALDLAGSGSARERNAVDGHAGAVLDAAAKAAYRRRLTELEAEADEADEACDLARAERARTERDFLVAELTAAVGLGGRDRVLASAAERARQSVTRAVRGAISRLEEAYPELGQHLEVTVRTGLYCAYRPDPRLSITWEVVTR